MFNNEDDVVAYEDELYREDTSSDEGIDSEVECYLYSQVHYSQNLDELDTEELKKTAGTSEKEWISKVASTKEKSSVIIISDSDDIRASDSSAVLILSDSLDEDSVNVSKNKRFGTVIQPTNQSTPKASITGKKVSKFVNSNKSYTGELVQEVLVISGSSDEEEAKDDDFLTSDSDQSGVENWMLLGRAKEDGDSSIQLNLEGLRSLREGDSEKEWSISQKDLEAHIDNYSRRRSNRYYTEDKNFICRNCNKRGHLSKNCPVPKKLPVCYLCGHRGHLSQSCLSPHCTNCFMPGHRYHDCTERPSWQKKCHRCAMIGHYADACPDIWRQYHLTVKPGPIKIPPASKYKKIVYCYNCGRKGHSGFECNESRMYSSVHPSCELISSYDSEHDIRKRNQRAKHKYKELQEAGLLPSQIIEPMKKESKNAKRESTKLSKKIRRKLRRESKHGKDKLNCHLLAINKRRKKKTKLVKQEPEDFPRGKPEQNLSKAAKQHKNKSEHLLFKYGKDKDFDGPLVKHKKKSKKSNRSIADLLTIKQRKKKSKKDD